MIDVTQRHGLKNTKRMCAQLGKKTLTLNGWRHQQPFSHALSAQDLLNMSQHGPAPGLAVQNCMVDYIHLLRECPKNSKYSSWYGIGGWKTNLQFWYHHWRCESKRNVLTLTRAVSDAQMCIDRFPNLEGGTQINHNRSKAEILMRSQIDKLFAMCYLAWQAACFFKQISNLKPWLGRGLPILVVWILSWYPTHALCLS